tara:strand:+ start:250 stop:1749 length:1500 start_codon:yes stop_codon:yes gene_type:complete
MRKIAIVAMNNSRSIGYKNDLIYRIPAELKHFKNITSKTEYKTIPNMIVMGRNTFESMNSKPLNGRFNCVISSKSKHLNSKNNFPNLRFFPNISTLMNYSEEFQKSYHNMFICGGESIYKYFIDNNLLDSMIITHIDDDRNLENDTKFPIFNNFSCISSQLHQEIPAKYIPKDEPIFLNYTINHYIPNYKIQNLCIDADNKSLEVDKSHDEYKYLDALSDIMKTGNLRKSRNSETISKFGVDLRFNISKSFPLLTTKKVYWNGVIKELLWFLNAETDSIKLSNNKVKIWDGNSSREFLDSIGLTKNREGDCGPIYGYQWRHFNAPYKTCDDDYSDKGVDQLQNIIDLIKNDPMSRRMIMSAWNPCQLEEMCLPPCHVMYQFYVHIDCDGKKHLSCSMYQRSGDMFLGIPFNIASTSLLTYIIAHHTNCIPHEVTIKIGDAHIYKDHLEAVTSQLKRTPIEFPQLNISCQIKDKITDYTIDDFKIKNYNPAPTIKAKMIA